MGVTIANKYLILERQDTDMGRQSHEDYIFVGICADFNRNENDRVYDKDDYLSHLPYLKEAIAEGTLLGELDHPEGDSFLVSMRNVSHKILDLWYDVNENVVKIKIALLDTVSGREARAIADSGTPIHVSSRASGYIDNYGNVTLDQIYTYDIVYKPGFKNARLERVNESLGHSRFNNNAVAIYEWSTINNSKSNNMEIKTKRVGKRKRPSHSPSRRRNVKESAFDASKMESYLNLLTRTINEHTDEINKLASNRVPGRQGKPSPGLASKVKRLEEKLDKLVKYSNDQSKLINEQADVITKLISYSNTISETVNEQIDTTKKLISYSNFIAGKVNEQVDTTTKLISYSNLISTTINEKMGGGNPPARKINKLDEAGRQELEGKLDDLNDELGELEATGSDEESIQAVKDKIDDVADQLAELEESKSYKRKVLGLRRRLRVLESKPAKFIKESKAPPRKSDKKSTKTTILENLRNRRIKGKGFHTKRTAQILEQQKLKRAAKEEGLLLGEFPFIAKASSEAKTVFENMNPTVRNQVKVRLQEKKGRITVETINETIMQCDADSLSLAILEKIPADLKPVWEGLTPARQQSIIGLSRLRNLNNDYASRMFWKETLGNIGNLGTTRIDESIKLLGGKDGGAVSTLGYGSDFIKRVLE